VTPQQLDGIRIAAIFNEYVRRTGGTGKFAKRYEFSKSTVLAMCTIADPLKLPKLKASTVIKAAVTCRQPCEDWLKAFRFDPAKHTPAIKKAIQSYRPPAAGDLVERVENSLERPDRASAQLVRVGVLAWAPFGTKALRGLLAPDRKSGSQNNDVAYATFFAGYARRLIGTVFPELTQDQIGVEVIYDIDGLLGGLAGHVEGRRLDLVMGLVDTVSRRRQGMLFTRVPGWSSRIGALAFTRSDRRLEWSQVIHPVKSGLRLVCVRQEVGWIFARGPLQIPASIITEATTIDTEQMMAWLVRQCAPKGVLQGDFVLLCDEEQCFRVFSCFKRLQAGIFERKTAAFTGHLESESAFAARVVKEVVPSPDDTRPEYPMTVCLPRGEERFRNLLSAAKREELFRNAVEDTARLYAEVCASAILDDPHLQPVPTFVGSDVLTWNKPAEVRRRHLMPLDIVNIPDGQWPTKQRFIAAFVEHVHAVLQDELVECLSNTSPRNGVSRKRREAFSNYGAICTQMSDWISNCMRCTKAGKKAIG
jgi:hypothetical protein